MLLSTIAIGMTVKMRKNVVRRLRSRSGYSTSNRTGYSSCTRSAPLSVGGSGRRADRTSEPRQIWVGGPTDGTVALPASRHMYFQLLGSLEVSDRGEPVAVGGGKRRALLGVLLLHANDVVSAERLIDELWGERPPATSAKSVQVYVSQLRRGLDSHNGELLVTRSNGYLLRVGRDDLDVQRFEQALAEGERALAAG